MRGESYYMYIVHSTFHVPLEKVEEVITIYQTRSKLVDQYEGFQSFHLLQNEVKKGELTVQIIWNRLFKLGDK